MTGIAIDIRKDTSRIEVRIGPDLGGHSSMRKYNGKHGSVFCGASNSGDRPHVRMLTIHADVVPWDITITDCSLYDPILSESETSDDVVDDLLRLSLELLADTGELFTLLLATFEIVRDKAFDEGANAVSLAFRGLLGVSETSKIRHQLLRSLKS